MNKKLLSLYGLKWNPFSPDLPSEALRVVPKVQSFCWRIEQGLVREGGFALITGDPGTGKSVVLRILAERLEALREVTVGALAHPQSNVADFYREMGELFGVQLKPHNRWGGFKALRERWMAHIDSTLVRPVLLIDEAQEMTLPGAQRAAHPGQHPLRLAQHPLRRARRRRPAHRTAPARGAAAPRAAGSERG